MLRVLCNKGKLAIIIPEESHKHEHQGAKRPLVCCTMVSPKEQPINVLLNIITKLLNGPSS